MEYIINLGRLVDLYTYRMIYANLNACMYIVECTLDILFHRCWVFSSLCIHVYLFSCDCVFFNFVMISLQIYYNYFCV